MSSFSIIFQHFPFKFLKLLAFFACVPLSLTILFLMCIVSLENPNAPKPWTDRDDRGYTSEMELRRREAAIYDREYAMYAYERSTRLEELERMYFDRYPPQMPMRDPYYDRYYDRTPPLRDPYMERYRTLPDMERGRYYDRPQVGMSHSSSFERAYYESRERSSNDRPRDDPYDRRDKDVFRDHSLRDREPFERFDSSRRL